MRAAATPLRRALPLALAALASMLPVLAAGAPPECATKIALEGVSDKALEGRLLEVVRREGGCGSPWVLRIAAAPKGQFVVALWTGSDLETRWATSLAEAEIVASLLLRVAVERQNASAPPAASSAASAPASATASVMPAASAAPPDVVYVDRPEERALSVGPFAGVELASGAQVGPSGGLELLYGRGPIRFGVAPRVGALFATGGSRTELALPVVVVLSARVGERFDVGLQAEAGASIQRAQATVGTSTATSGAVGLLVGGGPRVDWRFGDAWSASLVGAIRWSSARASADAASVTSTTTVGNPGMGKGKGGPPAKTTTTVMTDPASIDAVARLGGVGVGVAGGFAYAFLRVFAVWDDAWIPLGFRLDSAWRGSSPLQTTAKGRGCAAPPFGNPRAPGGLKAALPGPTRGWAFAPRVALAAPLRGDPYRSLLSPRREPSSAFVRPALGAGN